MRFLSRVIDPDATPLRWLTDHLATANTLNAQVGYLDQSGITLIAGPLRDMLDRGGQAHLLVDSRNDLPRRIDLAGLLDLFAPYGDRATVSLARDAMVLHSKVFVISDVSGERHALVGSANLTGAGLTRNWEACVALDPNDSQVLDQITASVMAWSAHPSVTKVDLGVLASMVKPGPTGASVAFAEILEDALASAFR